MPGPITRCCTNSGYAVGGRALSWRARSAGPAACSTPSLLRAPSPLSLTDRAGFNTTGKSLGEASSASRSAGVVSTRWAGTRIPTSGATHVT
jgi:hypothetical protein